MAKATKTTKEAKPNEAALGRALSAISRPRITEKATMQSERGSYAFEVADTATKHDVALAVKELYKVTPVKVNMVNLPRKKVFHKGRKGMKKGIKKAYVYLKKGDKIEFV